jgi:hypothetical protein
MSLTRMLRLSLVVGVAMACSSDTISAPLRGFAYAAAMRDCGPADGPAVAIYLTPNPVGATQPIAPFVRVYVPVQVDQLIGHMWLIGSANADAGAWFHPDTSTYELAETGYMVVNSVDSDSTITGLVDLNFPDAGHIRSTFRATWVTSHVLCG